MNKHGKKKIIFRLFFVIGAFAGFYAIFLLFTFSPILFFAKKYSNPTEQKKILLEMSKGETQGLRRALSGGRDAILALKKNLLFHKPLRFITVIDRHVAYFENLASLGDKALKESEKIADILDTALTPLKNQSSPPPDFSKHLLDTYAKNRQKIFSLQENSNALVRDFQNIDTADIISFLKKRHRSLAASLASKDALLRQSINFFELGLPMLGYPKKHTFLILLENNSELRPTGGFIGTYGILALADGKLESLEMENVYNLDAVLQKKLKLSPPWPLKYFGGITQWSFRDSNWSPNFPDSARQAIWFFEKSERQEKIDTVAAITPEVLKDIVGIFGKIELNGETLTRENIQDFLERHIGRDFRFENVPESERKDILNDLLSVLQQNFARFPDKIKLAGIFANIILENLSEKHLLLFSNIREVQEGLSMRGWGGEIQKTDGDYLSLIDANIGSLKTDPYVERSITYSVESKNSRGEKCVLEEVSCELYSEAKIRYNNTAVFTWKTTRYRTYLRLYVPYGSELLSVKGNETNITVVKNDVGKTSFGTFLVIEPQSSKTISFSYKLPKSAKEYTQLVQYDLLVQKQAGLEKIFFSGDFHIGKTQKTHALTVQKDTRVSFPVNVN